MYYIDHHPKKLSKFSDQLVSSLAAWAHGDDLGEGFGRDPSGEVRRAPDGAGRRVRHRPRKVPGGGEAAGAGVEALDRSAGPARCRAADDEDLVAERDGPGMRERGGKRPDHLREPGRDVVALDRGTEGPRVVRAGYDAAEDVDRRAH